MLINRTCLYKDSSVYIGSDADICSQCLDKYAEEHHITFTQARKELAGQLTGKKIFKIWFHGAYYILCPDHIRKLYELTNDNEEYLTVSFNDLSEEDQQSILNEVADKLKDENLHVKSRREYAY